MTITLRKATTADAEILAQLCRDAFDAAFGHQYAPQDLAQFFDDNYTPDIQLREITHPDMHVMLAQEQGRIIGYSLSGPCKLPVADMHPESYELQRIYLRKEATGKGVGSLLLKDAFAFFAARNAAEVYVGVWSGNAGAQKFYRAAGFEKIGGYNFMVGNHADDEWIMKHRTWPQLPE